jgi:beta-phosphoglucomutase-like phosphatase (HAD superfamily)
VINLVIFDCDGVLVDSERLAIKFDVQVLGRLGWHLSEKEVVSRFVGSSDAYFRLEVERHLGRQLSGNWEAEFQPLYQSVFEPELRAVDGIVEASIKSTCTWVASSGTLEKMRFTLGLTGLYDGFAGRIFSATEVERGKPAPDLFLMQRQRWALHPLPAWWLKTAPQA